MLLDLPVSSQVQNPPAIVAPQPPSDPNCTPKGCPVPAPVPSGRSATAPKFYAEHPGIFDETGAARFQTVYRVHALIAPKNPAESGHAFVSALIPTYSTTSVDKAIAHSISPEWRCVRFWFPESDTPF